MMKYLLICCTVLLLLVMACNTSKNGAQTGDKAVQMELTVSKIQDEKDGQTIFLEDDRGEKYTTIISPANGNWVELSEGDKISLVATEIMESYPAQIISKDIKVMGKAPNPMKTTIATDKQVYKLGEAINLSLTVENIGKKTATFLPWGTPIEGRFTGDCLTVRYNDGKPLPYRGIMVKRVPPTDKDYVNLIPNETTTGSVNILDGYQLDQPGKYSIQFKETYQGLPTSNVVELELQ